MILNSDSNDGDDHNCFKIIFVSSIVLVLHLSGVISVKRLSSLSQLYHPRTRHTYEWHFSQNKQCVFVQLENQYFLIECNAFVICHNYIIQGLLYILGSAFLRGTNARQTAPAMLNNEYNLVWFSTHFFKVRWRPIETMLNMTTILVPHIKSKWWGTSVASAGPSSASMRATKAHQLRRQHQGKLLFWRKF